MYRILFALCLFSIPVFAQKPVFKYPIRFQPPPMNMGIGQYYTVPFLKGSQGNRFSLVLRDTKTSRYLLIDDKFNIVDSFESKTDRNLFMRDYVGGTTDGNIYNFITTIEIFNSNVFRQQTVDFEKKETKVKILFELDKKEEHLGFFNSNNLFYAITAEDKSSSIIIRRVDEKGQVTVKKLHVKVPEGVSRKRDKISEYLKDTKVVRHEEETDFSLVSSSSKVFTSAEKLHFVINDNDLPTHLLSIDLSDLSMKETFFRLPEKLLKGDKDVYVSSFIADQRLFSLVLGRENIHVVSFDLATTRPLSDMEINENNYAAVISQPATTETRKGKKISEKQINSFRSVMKEMGKRTEGLMITKNENGKYIITIGTYDYLKVPTGSSGGSVTTSPASIVQKGNQVYTAPPVSRYTHSTPVYSHENARYYTSTRFGLLMDPATGQPVKGKIPLPVPEQVKDYLGRLNEKKTHEISQFNMNNEHYLGYYDKDARTYHIVEMNIRK